MRARAGRRLLPDRSGGRRSDRRRPALSGGLEDRFSGGQPDRGGAARGCARPRTARWRAAGLGASGRGGSARRGPDRRGAARSGRARGAARRRRSALCLSAQGRSRGRRADPNAEGWTTPTIGGTELRGTPSRDAPVDQDYQTTADVRAVSAGLPTRRRRRSAHGVVARIWHELDYSASHDQAGYARHREPALSVGAVDPVANDLPGAQRFTTRTSAVCTIS